ncbi:hypothetical protein [Alteromonas sp. a30]|uniref:hypothetical protein n=1 Tax=Alteromonas sp. a30 TaxID=2730917 RepID=UPI002280C6A5|nr:hypothetical protein [Alteromonas sp. a30]MCY7297305.1 hypothetical protein [Alteromonas sp. a30]
MNDAFKRAASGQTKTTQQRREQLYPALARQQTMIEQSQPVPVLKPYGMGEEAIDREIYRNQLRRDDARAKRVNQHYQPANNVTPTTLTEAFTMTNDTNNPNFDKMSQEQQRYVQLMANKKRLYGASQKLNEALQASLADGNNTPSMAVAQKISAASQAVQSTANNLAHQQKQIEAIHPEFKTQAVQYAKEKSQMFNQAQSQQQSF